MAADPLLLTGATGLVGEAVGRDLLTAGHDLLAVWSPDPPAFDLPGLTWIECDLAHSDRLRAIGGVTGIVHLAAAVPLRHDDSGAAAETNRVIDEAILRIGAARGVPLVYASSVAVYGDLTRTGLLDETLPPVPAGAYAQEKRWAEEEGRRRLGAAFTALRLCAPYGPRQWRGSVIQRFVERALDGGPITYLGEGSREQSFTHVRDIARAFRAAVAGPGGIFNITGAVPVTMRELALLAARAAGLDDAAVVAAGQPDPLGGERARYDIRAAERALGWRPQIDLSDGVRECLLAESARRMRCG